MKLFYVRVSTEEQNEARQLEMAKEQGADKVYTDKTSGKLRFRPALNEMLDFAREGDTIITESISRLSRSTRDFVNIMESLNQKGVTFISLKENIDTSSPQGRFVMTIFAALAELERETILQRQREGIEIAKKKGVYKGRPVTKYDKKELHRMMGEYRNGQRTFKSIADHFHVRPQTVTNWLKKEEEEK